MTLTRRGAATGLLASASAAFLPLDLAWADPAVAPPSIPEADEPDAEVDTDGDPFAQMVAPVAINGRGPFPFLIDTGANVSCISRKLAADLALQPGPPARVHSVVGVQMRPSVLIDQLQVGDRQRRSVKAPSLPIKGREVGGVLGVDWLKGQRLVLNVADRKLEITKSRLDLPRDGSVIVPARLRWGQLTIVDADLNGRPIQALIDSGSQVSLCNNALRQLVARIDASQAAVKPENMRRLETIMGEPFLGEQIFLPFMRLGGLQLGNVPIVCAETHVFEVWGVQAKPAVVLGMDLISQFKSVALDFGRSQVRFDV